MTTPLLLVAFVSLATPPAPDPSDLGWEAFGVSTDAALVLDEVAKRHVRVEGQGLTPAAVFRILLGFTPLRREGLTRRLANFGINDVPKKGAPTALGREFLMIARGPVEKDGKLQRELVEGCMDRASRERQKAMQGVALLRFTVDAAGRVGDSTVRRSTVRSAAFDRCLAADVRALVFPRPTDGRPVVVEYRAMVRYDVSGLFVDGLGLDGRQVADVLAAHKSDLRACHEPALAENPHLAMQVVLRFTILHDGTVRDASAPHAPHSQQAEVACLTEAIRGIEFPRPSDGEPVTVDYPLAFPPSR